MSITVFNREKELGLEDKIKAQSSIAYCSPVSNSERTVANFDGGDIWSKIVAGKGDPDVYHTYSILVSTVWNKNDDIFTSLPVWEARATPIFKMTNLEHDETRPVGTIIDSWPVDDNFNLISNDTKAEELPELYHLLVSSIIYRQFQNPELSVQAEDLIEKIEAGTMFVSMECYFQGFDYGIKTPAGQNHIIARSEETAFLSQHLRAYGGSGIYDGHSIGRVLRNLTFSGKGYVERPANPDSIIFDKRQVFSFANIEDGKYQLLEKNGVTSSDTETLNILETNMTDNILADQVKELKEALAAMQSENKSLAEKLTEANVSSLEAKIKETEDALSSLKDQVSSLEAALTESKAALEAKDAELTESKKAFEDLQANLKDMEDEKKKKDRKDKMSDAGMSDEDIEAKYDGLAGLTDDQFNLFVETVSSMKPAKSSEENEETSEASETETETDDANASEVVEEETEEDVNHSVSSEEEETDVEKARSALQEWVSKCVVNKK